MAERMLVQPDLEFIRHIEKAGGETLKQCYQCATCSTVCELSPAEKPFPRKEMLWAQWGLKDRLLRDPDVWLCHQCNDCSTNCPRGARPGDVLAAIRDYIYAGFTFPRFMGRALANPAALPLLFLFPILVIGALMMIHTGGDFSFLTAGAIEYQRMIPHGYIEMLFIGGNVLIFLIAGVGLWRFWTGLTHEAAREEGPGFIAALIRTVLQIATHTHFGTCKQNRPRQVAHLLVFYGFLGAGATAGLALFFTVIWPVMETPIDLPHPIKILGALSGLALFAGTTLMIVRRDLQSDDVGADGYPDRLFLWIVLFVGVTGLLTWLLRLTGIGPVAYPVYFIHLVVVFFLLWYMPYSKFAHMLYRTLAMIWALEHGREIAARQPVPALPPAAAEGQAAA